MPNQALDTKQFVTELREIKTLLQNLLIIEAARAGMTKAQARDLVGVADKRVSTVWKQINIPTPG